MDVLAVTPFAVSAGPRACLQALRTRVLAHSHGVLARRFFATFIRRTTRKWSTWLRSPVAGLRKRSVT